MFALVCKDGASDVQAQCAGVFEVHVVTAMSELKRLAAEGELEGVFADARLGVASVVRERLTGVPVYEYTPPFRVDAAMRWHEQIRKAAPEFPAQQTFTLTSSPSPPPEPKPKLPNPERPRSVELPFRHTVSAPVRRRTPVIMLDSPKGGAGRSTLGAHMAYYGALRGKRVAVIDLDSFGDIAQKFGFADAPDVRGWRGNSVEEAVRDGVCLVHESGLHLFPSAQSKEVVLQDPEYALHLLQLCLEEMDVVLLDMPQGWTPIHQAVLPYTTQVLFVVVPAVDQLARIQEHADKLVFAGLSKADVSPILNKSKKARSDERAMAQYLLPFSVRAVVPFDPTIDKRGGINGKRIVRAMKPFWDETFGFVAPQRRRWFGLFGQ
ncbi:AAA family ATPase [Alicyclobacillus macrosporangiidus]|uniref:Cellulose biosynthesis protein BcsQ n=1 Tax=Alicyclobacillus macrosporangiidus TaxID=392015 RepID=A0A1I7LEP5_9BACL|nr:P-loop NTPase [Alicyclobacillus macrosporangiidus]SFV08167.1 Cellulose biosynthesis protein BcsQ [Alicyclobacillus macrosporangiidus]